MSYHDKIMALPLIAPYAGRDYEAVETRSQAAEIAKEADVRIAELESCLREARANMEDWAMYVSEYFREKHGLSDDLAAIDKVLPGHIHSN